MGRRGSSGIAARKRASRFVRARRGSTLGGTIRRTPRAGPGFGSDRQLPSDPEAAARASAARRSAVQPGDLVAAGLLPLWPFSSKTLASFSTPSRFQAAIRVGWISYLVASATV